MSFPPVPPAKKKQPPPPPPSDSSESDESEDSDDSAHDWSDDDEGPPVKVATEDPTVIAVSGGPAADADEAPLFDMGAMASHKAAIKDDLAQAADQLVEADLEAQFDEFMAEEGAAVVAGAAAADESDSEESDEDEWESDEDDEDDDDDDDVPAPPAPHPSIFTAPTDVPTTIMVLADRPDDNEVPLFDTGAMATHQAALAGDLATAASTVADVDRQRLEGHPDSESDSDSTDSDESYDSNDDEELEDVIFPPQQTAEQAAQMDDLGDILGGVAL